MLPRKNLRAIVSLVSLLLSLQLCCNSSSAQETVQFVFMISATVNETIEKDTSGAVPAVQMALEQINNRTNVVGDGYRFEYSAASPINSECERTVSLDSFFHEINTPPNKVFLLGCGCSVATEPVAEISHLWDIVHMSYASLSPELVFGTRFPNFFRTVPNALSLVHIIHAIMDQYGWRQLAVISEEENLFSLVADELRTNFTNANMNITTINFDHDDDITDAAQNRFFNQSLDYRIYFLNMYHRHARAVLCAAYQLNMDEFLTPRYVWITLGWYPPRWWTSAVSGDDPDVPCSDSDLEVMLNRSLVIAQYPNASDPNVETAVGLTNAAFFREYSNRFSQGNYSYTFSAMFAYDAVWAMALALDELETPYNSSDFDDKDTAINFAQNLGEALMELEFEGVSGMVSFDKSGSRAQTNPRVFQYRFESNNADADEPVLIGTVDVTSVNGTSNATFLYAEDESNSTVWPVDIPFDGTPIIELRSILLPIFIIFAILAAANICFAVACAIVNFIFRNRKVIRLTSPNLNYLIILGTIVLSTCVYFYTYPALDPDVLYGMCIVRAYFQPLGFVLVYVTVSAKMWRIYYIFHNPTTKKKTIRDWQLLVIVMVAVVFVIIYVTIALIVDTEYGPVQVHYPEEQPSPNEYGIEVQFETLVCTSSPSDIWITLLFILFYLVIVVAVFLAFWTRKVKIKALNDAREIAAVIYVVFLILTIMLIAAIFLDEYRNADASVFSFGLLLGTFITLMFIFVPKWRSLYKDPLGENIFERSSSKSFASGIELTAIERDRMKQMSERISELEERLSKYETVTPFAARKRFLTSSGALDGNMQTRSLSGAALAKSGVGNRSLSFSPAPTASLPAILPATVPTFKFEPTSSIINANSKESPNTTSDSGVNVETASPNATLDRNGSSEVLNSPREIVENSPEVLESSMCVLVKNAV